MDANGGSLEGLVGALLDGMEGPAIAVAPDYRILAANRHYQESFGNGAGVVGERCYAVSHQARVPCDEGGESCPVRLAQQTRRPERVLHIHHTPRGELHVAVEARPIFRPDGALWFFIERIDCCSGAAATADGEGLVGRSLAFRRVIDLLRRVAPSATAALLLGESGTGKEVVARAIHDASPRHDRPFVPVECSGLTESLFESELFGHERGAFTGAHAAKRGLVEAARGGTLFLDEVGDIPPSLQVKLLRLLETRTFRRVGSVEPQEADFRLVCATHRDLPAMVADGAFRRDLYYRISAFPITLPALRDRREDIPLLAEVLLRRIPAAAGLRLSPAALDCLRAYDFPGNIRELRNLLERAVLLRDGDTILPEHLLGIARGEAEPAADEGVLTLDEVEQRYLSRVAARHRGDRRELAALLGVSERTLFRKLQALRTVKPPSAR
jgi:DNA-binding NtrC family response regulator